MSRTLLLVESDSALRDELTCFVRGLGMEVIAVDGLAHAQACLDAGQAPSVVLAALRLPDGPGSQLLQAIQHFATPPAVIFMTANDRIEDAIESLRYGSADFLCKPFEMQVLADALERARKPDNPTLPPPPDFKADEPTNQEAILRWRRRFAPDMLGSHPSMLRVFKVLERVADTGCTVLVTGESGTGKELVARALHAASPRRKAPFIAVNCAAIPENLVESEFFGHARGAFTGALQARVGKFQAADGGTIFLDEIGELPLAFQAKLLRLLQERCVTPVGESRPQRIDVRVIAATNRDLEEMVEDKSFREDLFYRLNVIPIDLPPLRERADDIPLLARAFVSRANARQARQVRDLNAEALAALIAYPWPGNIRQLENVIERAVVLKGQGQIALEDLPRKIRDASAGSQQLMQRPELPEEGIDLRDAVEKFENSLILQALERSGWNKNRAATILRMNRTTLVEKLKKKNLAESVASTS